jgi:hypothetical protein
VRSADLADGVRINEGTYRIPGFSCAELYARKRWDGARDVAKDYFSALLRRHLPEPASAHGRGKLRHVEKGHLAITPAHQAVNVGFLY